MLAPTFIPPSTTCVVPKWNMFSLCKAKEKGKWNKYPKAHCYFFSLCFQTIKHLFIRNAEQGYQI